MESLQIEKIKICTESSDPPTSNRIVDIDNKLAAAINDVNVKNYEKEIEGLKMVMKNKGRSAAIYKLKEKVLGPKENKAEAMGIEDPETGQLITEPGAINETTLNYCLDLLTDRQPKPEYEEIYKEKNLNGTK